MSQRKLLEMRANQKKKMCSSRHFIIMFSDYRFFTKLSFSLIIERCTVHWRSSTLIAVWMLIHNPLTHITGRHFHSVYVYLCIWWWKKCSSESLKIDALTLWHSFRWLDYLFPELRNHSGQTFSSKYPLSVRSFSYHSLYFTLSIPKNKPKSLYILWRFFFVGQMNERNEINTKNQNDKIQTQ